VPENYGNFKTGLSSQFAIINPVEHARQRFKQVRQTGSVRQYNNEIRTLMVEIPNLGTEELELNYIDGLKPHIKKDVKLHNLHGIEELMAAEDRIDNVTFVAGQSRDKREHHPFGNSSRRSYASSSGPSPMELGNLNTRYGKTPRPQGNSRWMPKTNANPGNGPRLSPEERKHLLDSGACFVCKEPGHLARDCPKRRVARPNGRAPVRR
jgi:hypothetical protein